MTLGGLFMQCEKCGAPLQQGDRVCLQCGTQVSKPISGKSNTKWILAIASMIIAAAVVGYLAVSNLPSSKQVQKGNPSSVSNNKEVSYMLNPKYTYEFDANGETLTYTFDDEVDDKTNRWEVEYDGDLQYLYQEKESKTGLVSLAVDPETEAEDYRHIDLKYPVEKGLKWISDKESDESAEIVSVSETVKTDAGKFDDCIKVKYVSKSAEIEQYAYYAPNIGCVKMEGKESGERFTYELVDLTEE